MCRDSGSISVPLSEALDGWSTFDGLGDAVVLWTGGKDSALALFEARERGAEVRGLVTFAGHVQEFKAHPRSLMRRQASSLGLPHWTVSMRRPYAGSYERILRRMKDEGIRRLITGDIAEMEGHERWLEARARKTGLELDRPLWGRDRRDLLDRVIGLGFRPVVTAVRTPLLEDLWVGRPLDRAAVRELVALAREGAIDLCGEHGEYHTMVLDGPRFRAPLSLGRWALVREGGLRYARLDA